MPKSILVIGITALLLTATNSFNTPNTISARRLSSTSTHKSPLTTLPAGHGHSSFLLAKKADASPDEEKQKKAVLDTVLNSIERNYGRGSIMRLGDNDSMDVDSISTGALTLDVALGGGLPRGRVVEIYGPESSGKTTLALHVAAASQKTGGVAAFIDAEHALDPAYAERLGVNVDELLVSQPDSGEMALDIVDQLVRSSAVDVVIIDSVAALVPRAELEGDMSDAQIGLQARLMSKAMRKITGSLSKSNCCVIFLNQLRSKVGVIYGSPEVTSGGNALKFYSSVRLDTRRKEVLPDNAGINVKVKVVKNKIAAPFKVIFFDILFGTGIDSLGCMLDAAADFDIVVRKGSWYSYKDTNFAQGKVRACAALEENPEMREEIEAQVREALLNLKNGDPVPTTVVAVDDPPKVGSLESEAEAETVVSE